MLYSRHWAIQYQAESEITMRVALALFVISSLAFLIVPVEALSASGLFSEVIKQATQSPRPESYVETAKAPTDDGDMPAKAPNTPMPAVTVSPPLSATSGMPG